MPSRETYGPAMSSDLLAQRDQVLQQMAALSTMELGSLKSEYRQGASGQPVGPYYKHQVWENGANVTRRVPADQAPALEAAIANRQRFQDLAAQFVELTVRLTRQNYSGGTQKKTSPPRVCWLRKQKSRT